MEREIESWSKGAPPLKIRVPEGYLVERKKGPDFDVHYIYSDTRNDLSVALYVGRHPSLRSKSEKENVLGHERDQVLGKDLEWINMKRKGEAGEKLFAEALLHGVYEGVSSDPVLMDLYLHMMVTADTSELLRTGKDIVKTLSR